MQHYGRACLLILVLSVAALSLTEYVENGAQHTVHGAGRDRWAVPIHFVLLHRADEDLLGAPSMVVVPLFTVVLIDVWRN